MTKAAPRTTRTAHDGDVEKGTPMPKTTTTDQAPTDDIEAEVDALVAAWERSETQNKRDRARDVVERRRFEQGRFDRVADIAYWEKRFARYGCRPVLAAWPTIPDFPRFSAGRYAPTSNGPALDQPRPVLYDSGVYRLDDAGIWLKRANYWICSPVFQIANGFDEANPDLYAAEVDGEWRTVPVDPGQSAHNTGAIPNALKAAGLRFNPAPVHFDGNLDAVPASRNQDHYTFEAWERLNVFLADHHRELPNRPQQRKGRSR